MSDAEKRFRIWYTDGEYDMGFLHHEGSHGRVGSVMKVTAEYAADQIALEKRYQPDMEFVAIPVDASKEENDRLVLAAQHAVRERQRKRWA